MTPAEPLSAKTALATLGNLTSEATKDPDVLAGSPIDSLSSIVADAVVEHEKLTNDAMSSVITLLTAKVKLGFLISFARELLAHRQGFTFWAAEHINLSLNAVYSLKKLAGFFVPDLETLALRRSLGLSTKGIVVGEAIFSQVQKSGLKSLSAAYRAIGVLKDQPRPPRHRTALKRLSVPNASPSDQNAGNGDSVHTVNNCSHTTSPKPRPFSRIVLPPPLPPDLPPHSKCFEALQLAVAQCKKVFDINSRALTLLEAKMILRDVAYMCQELRSQVDLYDRPRREGSG
jgi:hypothetical protein